MTGVQNPVNHSLSVMIVDADLNMGAHDLLTDDIKESTGANGVDIDGVAIKDSEVTTDVIHEKTSAAGVTIDGMQIKDNIIVPGANLNMGAHDLLSDDVKESTGAHGVDIDGVLMKDDKLVTLDAMGGSVINKNVSDNLRNSHDAEITDQTGAVYVKQKTMTFTYGIKGTLRVKYDWKSNNASYHVYARLYKNGVALGAVSDGNDTAYVTDLEDVDVGVIAAGETLELWGKAEHGSALIYLRNFRIYYDNEGSAAVGVNT